jgi:hypothetical protein
MILKTAMRKVKMNAITIRAKITRRVKKCNNDDKIENAKKNSYINDGEKDHNGDDGEETKFETIDGGYMTGETMAEAHGTELNKAANELTHGKSPSKRGGRGKGV